LPVTIPGKIEESCSKLQAIFDRKQCGLFYDPLAVHAADEAAKRCRLLRHRAGEPTS
jgi:hypothetical protein